MDTWVIIGGVASIVAVFSTVFLLIVRAVGKMSSVAFDKGVHSQTHEKLDKDISTAHRRLDTVEDKVSVLETSIETNIIVHENIVKNQDIQAERLSDIERSVNGRLDSILEILVVNK